MLGASNLTYAEATWTQGLPDWIGAHVRMFRFFGARPRLLVPDNLRSGVHKASFYDPEINRSYGAMAAHYGAAFCRPGRAAPRIKSKVEIGVRFAQTLSAACGEKTFFSLADANAAIAGALAPHQRSCRPPPRRHPPVPLRDHRARGPGAPAGRRVRVSPSWRLARVGVDDHVEHEGFFYSVPHGLIRAQVDLRATSRTIELFHRGQRVALHQRRYGGRRHGTDPDHMIGSAKLNGVDPQAWLTEYWAGSPTTRSPGSTSCCPALRCGRSVTGPGQGARAA